MTEGSPPGTYSSQSVPPADISGQMNRPSLTAHVQETNVAPPGSYASPYDPPTGTRTRLPDHALNSSIGEGRVQPDSDYIGCPRMVGFEQPCHRSFATPELLRGHLRDYHIENITGPTRRELIIQQADSNEDDNK